MPDVIEAVKNLIGSFTDDEPKPPLHIGEAMNCWLYIAGIAEALTYEQAAVNTTTDTELRDAVQEAVKLCDSQVRRLRDFMEREGIPLPPLSEPKPKSDSAAIPLGVKLTDDEIANGVSIKAAAAVVTCATGVSQSLRNDVGLMWIEFQQEHIIFAMNLKTLMRKRGWLKVPPLYCPPGTPLQ